MQSRDKKSEYKVILEGKRVDQTTEMLLKLGYYFPEERKYIIAEKIRESRRKTEQHYKDKMRQIEEEQAELHAKRLLKAKEKGGDKE